MKTPPRTPANAIINRMHNTQIEITANFINSYAINMIDAVNSKASTIIMTTANLSVILANGSTPVICQITPMPQQLMSTGMRIYR